MFGALAGAIPAIIGAVLQGQAMQDQNYTNEMNLQFQKQNAAKQYDLATAARSDAYGNKVSFDDLLKEWVTKLTPEQQSIINAMQKEQKLSLTEDAGRARDLRRRQDVRSHGAENEYDKLLNDWKFNPPKSEGAYQDEAVTDQILANDDKRRGGANQLATLAVRAGQDPQALTRIINAVADQNGASLGENLQKGKAAGRQTYAGETQIHQSKLDPIKFFAGLMDNIDKAPMLMSDTPGVVNQNQRDMASMISGALTNESSQVGGAFSELARSLGQSPDLSGIASALSGLGNMGMGGGGQTPSLTAPIVQPFGSSGGGIFDDPIEMKKRIQTNPTNGLIIGGI